MMALNDEQQRLLTERNQLLVQLQEAETALAGATAASNTDVYHTMVEVLRREKDDLLAQRDNLEAQLAELRRSDAAPVPAAVQDMLSSMADEKARLEMERSQLQGRLGDLEAQLAALGIENGAAGLAQLVGRLHEQRAVLQTRYDALKHERDVLLSERTGLEASIAQAQEREKQIEDLQKVVKNLAADREAAIKQRDALRSEREELLAKQDSIKEHRARLIAEAEAYRQELEEAQEVAVQLRRELQTLADAHSTIAAQVDQLQAEKGAVEGERELLLARVEGDRSRLEQLGADGVGSLTRIIEELTTQRAQLEHQLHEARTELAGLESQMGMLQAQALPATRPARQPQDPALILGMVQELRTPLTSIMGYVDLLLSESAGILGEMQRRFLQRVAANVARLLSMMEDLTRITALDMGELVLLPEPVDLVGVIEDAITASGHQFREKGLTVHLNLADELPFVSADHDALNQIVGQLLTNAYLASPPDGEIFISASRQAVSRSNNGSRQSVDSLLVSVEDRGGGIALEDQGRVFARKYKAENPLIQGLGDTGVGMAIAKALIEAHGGVLWLETREQVGSVFYFALPLAAREQTEG
jgi:signal transduction histidine kinase